MNANASPSHQSPAIVLLLVENDEFNREGVRLYLEQQGFRVLEAGDEESAWQLALTHQPDVAVVDIEIPPSYQSKTGSFTGQNVGIRLANRLKQLNPALGIVFFSAYEDRGSMVWELIREAKRGMVYKLKGCRPDALLKAIFDAMAGYVFIDREVMLNLRTLADDLLARLTDEERPWVEEAINGLDRLTPREQDVARLLAASHNVNSIARSLNISVKAAENYVGRVYHKLGLGEMAKQASDLRKIVILAKAHMIKEFQIGYQL
jgi:DNA-binding NarL/FixJ family response regulator